MNRDTEMALKEAHGYIIEHNGDHNEWGKEVLECIEAALKLQISDVDNLASFIRKIDGNNTMGAGELAARILSQGVLNRWQPIESAPKDGKPFYVKADYQVPFKWKSYKPNSQQFKRGIKGRWQEMNEYGGWDNSDKTPDFWKPHPDDLPPPPTGGEHE